MHQEIKRLKRRLGSLVLIFTLTTTTVEAYFTIALPTQQSYYHIIANTRRVQQPLFAKPKRKYKRKSSNDDDDDVNVIDTTTVEIPANLRRKIIAKRPSLGHVVPKEARVRMKQSGGSSVPKLRPQGKAREAGLNNPSMLKIAGGIARGRRLDSPNVFLRPMMGKVKEAVFSTFASFGLYDVITGDKCSTRHLDIFAGSGSVGLESLSRGAAHCTFVDFSDDCCSCIERNLQWTNLLYYDNNQPRANVICADAIQTLRDPSSVGILDGTTYQIITLCPPYEEIVYGDLLEAVVGSTLVTDDTVILIEYPIELGCLPHVITYNNNTAIGLRNRRYGRTVIAMYVINPTGKLSDAATSRPEEFISL